MDSAIRFRSGYWNGLPARSLPPGPARRSSTKNCSGLTRAWTSVVSIALLDHRGASLDPMPLPGFEPVHHAAGFIRLNQKRAQERPQLFGRNAAHQLALKRIGNGARLFRYDHNDGIGLLAETNSSTVSGAERLIEVLAAGQGKNTGSVGNLIAFNDHPTVVDGVVRKENGFEHFRGRQAMDRDARFDRFLELDVLLNGDQRADPHVAEALDRLDDHFDILTLFMAGLENR